MQAARAMKARLNRRHPRDEAVLAVLLVVLSLLTASRVFAREVALRSETRAPFCHTAEEPQFAFGFATLSELLGETMGQPLACEHALSIGGDTQQQTTTGTAFYHRCTNTSIFSRDSEHWALTSLGLLYWTGDRSDLSVDLPQVHPPDLRHPCGPSQ